MSGAGEYGEFGGGGALSVGFVVATAGQAGARQFFGELRSRP
ncbi:hypothetical protein APA_3246 [Pseudanabaena sp. lw0831]|nr:hypothetical protein APA_3246 [Pseudanabaena sp. lw0831]